MKTFQTIFLHLAPHKIALSSARCVVLVAYNTERPAFGRLAPPPHHRRETQCGAPLQLGGIGGAGGGGCGGCAAIGVGNERAHRLCAARHRRPRSTASASASASVDGGGYKIAVSEVSSAEEDEDEDVVALAEDYIDGTVEMGRSAQLVKITEGVPGREGHDDLL